MNKMIIARRYANALIQIAREKKSLETTGQELDLFFSFYQGSPELRNTLSNIHFLENSRFNVITKIGKQLNISEYLVSFLKTLIKKGRFSLLDEIVTAYQQQKNRELNQQDMLVVSTTELPAEHYDELKTFFSQKTGKTIFVKKEFVPDMIGGLLVKIGDHVYDYTIKKQLKDLREKMDHHRTPQKKKTDAPRF